MTPRRRTSHGGAFFEKILLFPLDFSYSREYNSKQKGGETVKKKKKKSTKTRLDVRTIVITAIVDFLVGLALLLIDKHT